MSKETLAFKKGPIYNQSMTNSNEPQSYEEWDVQQALDDAIAEKTLLSTSYEDQTRNHLQRAAPAAARSIINIALYSQTERLRLQAAQYIIDRNLGRIGEEKQSSQTNPLEDLLADVVQTAEAFTRKAQ